MRAVERIIYDDIDGYDFDEYRNLLLEVYLDNGGPKHGSPEQYITDDDVWTFIYDRQDNDFMEEKSALRESLDLGYGFLAKGVNKRWDGTSRGYEIVDDFNNLLDGGYGGLLNGCDKCKIWDENGHLHIEGTHHDGGICFEVRPLTSDGRDLLDAAEYEDTDTIKEITGESTLGIKDAIRRAWNDLSGELAIIPRFAEKEYGLPPVAFEIEDKDRLNHMIHISPSIPDFDAITDTLGKSLGGRFPVKLYAESDRYGLELESAEAKNHVGGYWIKEEDFPLVEEAAKAVIGAVDINFVSMNVGGRSDLACSSDDSYVLAQLAHDSDSYVRERVASNPNTSPETLAELAKDIYEDVRYEVAHNENTPFGIIESLSRDEDEEVRGMALLSLAVDPRTPPDVLSELAYSEYWQLRQNISYNDNTPNETLAELTKNSNKFVRLAATNALAARNQIQAPTSRAEAARAEASKLSIKAEGGHNHSLGR